MCSLECKARHLKQLGLILRGSRTDPGGSQGWEGGGWSCREESGDGKNEGERRWRYVEHPEVASWKDEDVESLRTKVYLHLFTFCNYFNKRVLISPLQ